MDKLKEELNGILTEIRNLAAKAETENRDFTDDERALVTERMAKGRAIQEQITAAKVSKVLADDVQEFLGKAAADALNEDALDGTQVGIGGRRTKSLGQYFTDSKQFKAAMEKHGGREVKSGTHFGLEAPVPVAGGLKALIGTDPAGDGTGAGTLWDPQRLPTVQATWPALKLRNVITVGTTSSDAVSYARILRAGAGSTNAAAGVPEATKSGAIGSGTPAVTTITGGVKPESALNFEKVNAPVITVAHWVPATKKALSDAGQLRTLIDAFLTAGLNQEIERQIIGGDSTAGEEFDGIINQDGIQTQAFDTNILVTVRKAITKVSKYGVANAVLVSPGTAERIDLLRTSTGQYLGGGAFGPANPTVWRKPIIEIPGLADSTVIVGDLSTCVLWDREDISITATDSHADFFVRNLVAILAEARAAFGCLDPALLVKVTVTGTDEIVPPAASARPPPRSGRPSTPGRPAGAASPTTKGHHHGHHRITVRHHRRRAVLEGPRQAARSAHHRSESLQRRRQETRQRAGRIPRSRPGDGSQGAGLEVMAALPPLALVSELAGITGRSPSDQNLVGAIRDASRRFRGAVHHDVTLTVGETVEAIGDGSTILLLPAFPVVIDPDATPALLLTVTVDGTELVAGSDYRVDKTRGILERVGYRFWPRGIGRVEVTYSHGYERTVVAAAGSDPERLEGVPEDIQAAILGMAQILLNVTPGVQSKTVLGDTTQFGAASSVGATQEWVTAVENYKLRYGA
jgi:HK97 family phage major capsid protein